QRYMKGDLDGAIADFTRAIESGLALDDARRPREWNMHGEARPGHTAPGTKRVSILDPFVAMAYTNRGLARYGKGDFGGAIEDSSGVMPIIPGLANAYNIRGIASYAMRDLDSAMADFSNAIKLDPLDPRPYNNRGNARFDKGDLEGALKDFDQSIALGQRD